MHVCLGCGKDGGPARYAVEGTVTFDGKPLAEGEIIFVPSPSGPQPDAGPRMGRMAMAFGAQSRTMS